jgi:sigma-B regulation protein RsbU (phosphoserine phosphatase)
VAVVRDDTAGAESDQSYAALLDESAEDLYEHAPCGYLSTLPSGTIIKVNETFLAWTGHRREDLIGRVRLQELLSTGDRILYDTHVAPLLQMQSEVQVAADLRCTDGTELPTLMNSVLRRNETGEPVLIRTTLFDATDRRQYERELLRARHAAEVSETRARVLAETLQESLIPPTPPKISGFDVAARYRPAGEGDEVGGDFYDVFETDTDDWVVVLGDVCGKGVEAAKVTALARYTIRTAAMQARRPSAVLAVLNQALLHQRVDRFLTVVYARIQRHSSSKCTLTIASGGHPLPVRVTRDGSVDTIGRSGSLLGVLAAPKLHDTAVQLAAGDVVFFHTDGITEARREQAFFGDARLKALLASHRNEDAASIARRIVDDAVDFQSGRTRDDIAVVVLKVPEADAV